MPNNAIHNATIFFENKRKKCHLCDEIHYDTALAALRMKQRLEDPSNYRPCPNCHNDVEVGACYCSACGQCVPNIEEDDSLTSKI